MSTVLGLMLLVAMIVSLKAKNPRRAAWCSGFIATFYLLAAAWYTMAQRWTGGALCFVIGLVWCVGLGLDLERIAYSKEKV